MNRDGNKNWNKQYGYQIRPASHLPPSNSLTYTVPTTTTTTKTSNDVGVGAGTFIKKRCGIVRK